MMFIASTQGDTSLLLAFSPNSQGPFAHSVEGLCQRHTEQEGFSVYLYAYLTEEPQALTPCACKSFATPCCAHMLVPPLLCAHKHTHACVFTPSAQAPCSAAGVPPCAAWGTGERRYGSPSARHHHHQGPSPSAALLPAAAAVAGRPACWGSWVLWTRGTGWAESPLPRAAPWPPARAPEGAAGAVSAEGC
eukprot:1162017-Pelagomonas_calceolata.AAC.3